MVAYFMRPEQYLYVPISQPFQYQGSKRNLAPAILHYMPMGMDRLVEPFAGSAAISIACASRGLAKKYWINDFNEPLARLLSQIVDQPNELIERYHDLWQDAPENALEHYYRVRREFNHTQDPKLLLYLLARCVKGSVRYNSEGLFNQSPDKRRLGTRPDTMRRNILGVSALLRGKTIVTAHDYRTVLANVGKDDVVYMDPPYQGVCGERDGRYFAGISFADFVSALQDLNSKGTRYLVSYDGRLGKRIYGRPLPEQLELTHIELDAGRSAQATLLGRNDVTIESLYLSRSLAEEIGAVPSCDEQSDCSQLSLFA